LRISDTLLSSFHFLSFWLKAKSQRLFSKEEMMRDGHFVRHSSTGPGTISMKKLSGRMRRIIGRGIAPAPSGVDVWADVGVPDCI
jgi:hypothetical protein